MKKRTRTRSKSTFSPKKNSKRNPKAETKSVSLKRSPSRETVKWEDEAYRIGAESVGWFWPNAADNERTIYSQWVRQMNERWARWLRKQRIERVPENYPLACRRFIRGFCEAANQSVNFDLLLPTRKTVACIITAMNESETLETQLNELHRLPFHEVIVVLNGSSDASYEVVRNHPIGATVVHFDAALGYDVGRAVGAKMSSSDALLFLDGDMSVEVKLLLPFLYELEKGADVVLNPISGFLPDADNRDSVSNVKQFLNMCLGRSDLQADSLTAVPHALSRKAIEQLGCSVLSVPPVAHAQAIRAGLSVVSSPQAVDVIRKNRVRKQNVGVGNDVEKLILGDHLEAIAGLMEVAGPRLTFHDRVRQRLLWEGEETQDTLIEHDQLVTV